MDPGVRFGLLGPVALADGAGQRAVVPGARQRVLLAALLLSANVPVSAGALGEAMWDGSPPAGAAATLRSHVGRLRRALGPENGGRIVAQAPGYLICVQEPELDVLQFEALCRAAGAARRDGRWADASTAAGRALGLWRGDPLLDIPSHLLRDEFVPRLEQLRLQALQDQIEAALRLGQHDQLVPRLRDLTARQPLQERFHGQLMQALAAPAVKRRRWRPTSRPGRCWSMSSASSPAPSCSCCTRRSWPATPRFPRRLEHDLPPAAGASPAPVAVPRQLPAAAGHFTGRRAEVAELTAMLDPARADGAATAVAVIDGPPGAGKTALAVHWAHRAAASFPDGQLFVNLQGSDPAGSPVSPADALRGFLEALGVAPERLPRSEEGLAGLYRSLLASQRVLVVLDNARDAAQARPLLPGSGCCRVIVTSRSQLTGLVAVDDAARVTVTVMNRGRGPSSCSPPGSARSAPPKTSGRSSGSRTAAEGCRWRCASPPPAPPCGPACPWRRSPRPGRGPGQPGGPGGDRGSGCRCRRRLFLVV